MYGAWCFGDISRTADTLVLYKTVWGEHVCTVNVWDWLTGPLEREKKKFFGFFFLFLRRRVGLMEGAGLVPMLLWTEWVSGGNRSACVSPSGSLGMGQDGGSCLSCLAPRLGGVLWSFWGLGFDRREKVDVSAGQWPRDQSFLPLGHCMTGAFFGVFGAATKCAMCYVAWFIIFLQATKLICSPIV